jgi:ATP-dependent DNA helicase RecG
LSHSGIDSSHKEPEDLSHKLDELPPGDLARLRTIAGSAHRSPRLPTEEPRKVILDLCEGRYFTAADLDQLMNRNPNSLRNRFLTPMVDAGLLERKYPEEPNRPDQAYTTKR